jgi:hypothetical protein
MTMSVEIEVTDDNGSNESLIFETLKKEWRHRQVP